MLDHRRGSDRDHGGGDRAACRRAPRRHHRHQRLSARSGATQIGATRAVNVGRENLRAVMEEPRHDRGLRRRTGNVGRSGGLLQHARAHESRRQDCACSAFRRRTWRSTGIRSSSRASKSKGSTGAKCSRPGTRWSAMLQSGLDLTPIITHRFAAEQFEDAFATMQSGQSGKVILDWAA